MPVGTNPGANQSLTPDRVAAYLRGLSHRVEQGKFPNEGIVQQVIIAKPDFRWAVNIEFTLDQQTFCLSSPVGNPSMHMPAAQLVEILKASFRLYPYHFSIVETDQKLQLFVFGPIYSTNVTEGVFQSTLDRLLKAVRDTSPLWDTANPANPTNPVNPAPVVAPVEAPTPVVAPAPLPAPAPGLANTTWVGSEQGFGRLEFRFQPSGQVTMIDTDGSHPGTYSLQGNAVALTFYNGGVVYNGILNGQTIAGSAQNAKKTWNFSVNR